MDFKPILLVEDSPNDAELTLEALHGSALANDVVVMRDGAEALDYLFRQGDHADRASGDPAVILLDLKLPKVNGMEVLAAVRQHPSTQRIPVVILTSSREQLDLARGYQLGANAFVVKPVGFPAFSKAIQELGAFWAVLNEPPPARA